MDDFPGNPRSVPAPTPTPPPAPQPTTATPADVPVLQPVITGGLVARKPTLGSRLKNAFIKTDAKTVGGFILTDVIVPTIRGLIMDVATQAVYKTFGVEIRLPMQHPGQPIVNTILRSPASPYPYNQVASNQTSIVRSTMPAGPPAPMAGRPPVIQPSSVDVGEVVVRSQAEAMDIHQRLTETLGNYRVVRVANLSQVLGLVPTPIDYKFGWYNLDEMTIRPLPGSVFQVVFPAPVQLIP